jgi:hypothetical protein
MPPDSLPRHVETSRVTSVDPKGLECPSLRAIARRQAVTTIKLQRTARVDAVGGATAGAESSEASTGASAGPRSGMDASAVGSPEFMTNNPIELQKYLSGVDYPADKQTLVRTARDQGADDDVIKTLESLPSDRFNSPNDVSEAFGKR